MPTQSRRHGTQSLPKLLVKIHQAFPRMAASRSSEGPVLAR
jgi:hypothetical protein